MSTPNDEVVVTNDTCVVDCSSMQPPIVDSVVDDTVIDELSTRFAGVPVSKSSAVSNTVTPTSTLSEEISAAEAAKFNEMMGVISSFAEDVVKTWIAKVLNRDLKTLFPDGLQNHTASIRMVPSPELIAERRAAMASREEARENDRNDELEEFKCGWELKLAVVDSNYRINLNDWKKREPDVLRLMGDLLLKARSYIMYAIESYEFSNEDANTIANTLIPSQFGTLYLLGAPHDSPQIGVVVERIRAE